MKNLANRLKKTINVEEKRKSEDPKIREFEQLLDEVEQYGCAKKPEYTFPLIDTIGKSTYALLNNSFSRDLL
jgi:hypothetical protein